MEIRNKVIVITGGAGGIGLAIAKMFLTEDPKIIVLADINFDNVDLKNNKVIYKNCNIASESELNNLIDDINDEFGLIDIFCSNAGILTLGDEQSTNEDWNKNCRTVRLQDLSDTLLPARLLELRQVEADAFRRARAL